MGPNVLTVQGDWRQSERLRGYAAAHRGLYIVCDDAGTLCIQREPTELARTLSLYGQVEEVEKSQQELQMKQAPLNNRQADLTRRMKEARTLDEIQRLGAEQGKLGAEQRNVGVQQSRVGAEQGLKGRAFYNEVQTSLDRCIHIRMCVAVE